MNHVLLSSICEIIQGIHFRERVVSVPQSPYLLLQLRDVDAQEIVPTHAIRITPPKDKKHQLQTGDLVIPAKGSSTQFALYASPMPMIASSAFYIIRPNAGVDSQYLAFVLNAHPTQAILHKLRAGSVVRVLKKEVLQTLEIPLPPLAQQQTIGALAQLARRRKKLKLALAQTEYNLLSSQLEHLIYGKEKTHTRTN